MSSANPLDKKFYRIQGDFFHKGTYWVGWTDEARITKFETEFKLLPSDIILTGYAKSGNTLLAEIVCLLVASKGCESKLSEAINWVESVPIYIRVPFAEELFKLTVPQLDHEIYAMEYLDWMRESGQVEGSRLIKTHLTWDSLKCALNRMDQNELPRIVYVYRNPKDASVSMYHFYRAIAECGPYKGDWTEFFQMWIDGCISGGDWRIVVRDWLLQAKKPSGVRGTLNILPISYERLVRDPWKCVHDLHEFLFPNAKLDQKVVEVIVERTSFKKMRENKMTNYENVPGFESSFRFMRSGKIGDWKNWFTVAQNEQFTAEYESVLKELNEILAPDEIIFE
ncbi:Aryl sulfotransferase [Paragonimus heterotremus]|uniref:Aryl sulfotransferase n=1 Tax=Paragonimus heterotremus TaxID=100268 RepID=A0A8J4TMP1_9TREM|nr:Aryl sulfotransferase [Paragonimus heterotremus]